MHTLRALSLATLLLPAALSAQGVLVSPTGVFIDHRTRSGSIELYNPGDKPAEVAISTVFGYPVSDSLGKTTVRMIEAADAGAPSAAGWIEAFPRKLTLRPQTRQTVRLLAKPPANLPDGEYWSRVIIEAKGAAVPALVASDSAPIQVGVSVNVRTIIALFYRKGNVATGLALTNARAEVARDTLTACAHFERKGSGAFLGTMRGRLADAAGKQVASFAAPLAVYYTLDPCFSAPARDLPPGRYVAHLVVDTDRDDLKRESILPMPAMRDSVIITVPAGAR